MQHNPPSVVELPEAGKCSVSVTEVFPLPAFHFTGHSLENLYLFFVCVFIGRPGSCLLPSFYHTHYCPLVGPSCLDFCVPQGWLEGGFLSQQCCVSWLLSLQLKHYTQIRLVMPKKIWGFLSWLIPWFLQTENYVCVVTSLGF